MASTKHTPGPWVFTVSLGTGGVFCGYEVEQFRREGNYDYRGTVAWVMSAENIEGITREEAHANVRLIAAAPDMLAALRRAALALAFSAESSAAMQDDYKAVSDAIAKAVQS